MFFVCDVFVYIYFCCMCEFSFVLIVLKEEWWKEFMDAFLSNISVVFLSIDLILFAKRKIP